MHRGYVRQLALYRAVLRGIYPGRTIRAALIWTDKAALMDIPQRPRSMRNSQCSHPRDAGLTPAGAVHTFGNQGFPALRFAEVFHGR